jgi:hypothetical protein
MNTDSLEYEILEEAVERVADVFGFTCEIGVREGGGTKLIMDTLKKTGQKKIHIAIDPFGNIEYDHWESRRERVDYTNDMKRRMLKNLYEYCHEESMECLFFPLEDTEFFKRYADGVPIYNESKIILNQYALVFFDGPHTTDLVLREFEFFRNKVPIGGALVFDDINQYPHMKTLDSHIRSCGFKVLTQGNHKISYIRRHMK